MLADWQGGTGLSVVVSGGWSQAIGSVPFAEPRQSLQFSWRGCLGILHSGIANDMPGPTCMDVSVTPFDRLDESFPPVVWHMSKGLSVAHAYPGCIRGCAVQHRRVRRRHQLVVAAVLAEDGRAPFFFVRRLFFVREGLGCRRQRILPGVSSSNLQR